MPMIQNVTDISVGSDVQVGSVWHCVSRVESYPWGAPAHAVHFTDGGYRVFLDSAPVVTRNYV